MDPPRRIRRSPPAAAALPLTMEGAARRFRRPSAGSGAVSAARDKYSAAAAAARRGAIMRRVCPGAPLPFNAGWPVGSAEYRSLPVPPSSWPLPRPRPLPRPLPIDDISPWSGSREESETGWLVFRVAQKIPCINSAPSPVPTG